MIKLTSEQLDKMPISSIVEENGDIKYKGEFYKLTKTDIKKLGEYAVIDVRPVVVSTVVNLGIELFGMDTKPIEHTEYVQNPFTDPFITLPEDRKYNIRTKDTSTTIGCTKSLEELCLENGYGYDSGYNEVI